MTLAGFEPVIPVSDRSMTVRILDCEATGISIKLIITHYWLLKTAAGNDGCQKTFLKYQ